MLLGGLGRRDLLKTIGLGRRDLGRIEVLLLLSRLNLAEPFVNEELTAILLQIAHVCVFGPPLGLLGLNLDLSGRSWK